MNIPKVMMWASIMGGLFFASAQVIQQTIPMLDTPWTDHKTMQIILATLLAAGGFCCRGLADSIKKAQEDAATVTDSVSQSVTQLPPRNDNPKVQPTVGQATPIQDRLNTSV